MSDEFYFFRYRNEEVDGYKKDLLKHLTRMGGGER